MKTSITCSFSPERRERNLQTLRAELTKLPVHQLRRASARQVSRPPIWGRYAILSRGIEIDERPSEAIMLCVSSFKTEMLGSRTERLLAQLGARRHTLTVVAMETDRTASTPEVGRYLRLTPDCIHLGRAVGEPSEDFLLQLVISRRINRFVAAGFSLPPQLRRRLARARPALYIMELE